MAIFECVVCGKTHNEEKVLTRWADLPQNWHCPICDSDKSCFRKSE